MKIDVSVKLNLKTEEATEKVKSAVKKAMKETIVDVANGAMKNSPKKTGNNMRRIAYQVPGEQGQTLEGPVDGVELNELEGAVYSTSGYGGYLETGTSKMTPRPYIKLAVDVNFTADKFAAKVKENLGQ